MALLEGKSSTEKKKLIAAGILGLVRLWPFISRLAARSLAGQIRQPQPRARRHPNRPPEIRLIKATLLCLPFQSKIRFMSRPRSFTRQIHLHRTPGGIFLRFTNRRFHAAAIDVHRQYRLRLLSSRLRRADIIFPGNIFKSAECLCRIKRISSRG